MPGHDHKFKQGDHVRPRRKDFHYYQGVIAQLNDVADIGIIALVKLDVPCPQNSDPDFQALHQDILELVP